MYLTMKLEPVLTTKIVDNSVRFGMPYFNHLRPGNEAK